MWQSDYVDLDSVKIHYHRTGGDKPPMVMLHGILSMGLSLTSVAEVLQADYDIVMIDFRGHGLSDKTPEHYDIYTFATDVLGVINALELESPIILGHSLGAITLQAFAGMYPDVPKAIILSDPPPFWYQGWENSEAQAQRADQTYQMLTDFKSKTKEELIEIQRQQDPHASEKDLNLWAEAKLLLDPKVANMYRYIDSKYSGWEERFAQTTCPVLILTADTELGSLVSPEAADYLKSHVPQTQVAHIADAGHGIYREQFDKFMEAVQAYIKQLD